MPRGRGPSKHIDWKKAERLFRQGIFSYQEIATQVGAKNEATIRMHAKSKGWKRDLTHEVRQEARNKFIESMANFGDADKLIEGRTDQQLIEEAARTIVQVVRDHQTTLKRGHTLTLRMLDELDATTAHMGELQKLITDSIAPARQEGLRRAIGLAQRAVTLKELANSARIWVALERQAFNIVDESKNPEVKDLENKSSEDLRKEILDDAKRMGLDLSSEELDGLKNGVAAGKVH